MILAFTTLHPEAAVVGALALAILMGAVSAAVTGFGFSLVSAPMFILLLGAGHGVRLGNMFSCFVSAIGVWSVRRVMEPRTSATLIAPAMVVTPLAAVLVNRLDRNVVMITAGVITVVSVLIIWRGFRFPQLRGMPGLIAAASTSAAMNVLSSLSGPPIALYSVNAGWSPERLRRVSQPYFFLLNLAAVASLGPLLLPVPVAAVLVGCGVVGFVAGRRLAPRLDVDVVRRVVLMVAGAGGFAAVLRGAL